jgi:hypothetical protein
MRIAVVCVNPECDHHRRYQTTAGEQADHLLIFDLRCPHCLHTRLIEQAAWA